MAQAGRAKGSPVLHLSERKSGQGRRSAPDGATVLPPPAAGAPMSDRLSLVLASCAILLIGADLMLLQTGAPLFLARKLIDLVEYLAFWR